MGGEESQTRRQRRRESKLVRYRLLALNRAGPGGDRLHFHLSPLELLPPSISYYHHQQLCNSSSGRVRANQLVSEWVTIGRCFFLVVSWVFVLSFFTYLLNRCSLSLDGAEEVANRRRNNQLPKRQVPKEDREGTPGVIRATKALLQDQPRSNMCPCVGLMLRRQRRLSRKVCACFLRPWLFIIN